MHYAQDDQVDSLKNQDFITKEYPFCMRSFKVDNFEAQYKRIKICKNCYIIYSLAQKHFDEKLKNQMQLEQL